MTEWLLFAVFVYVCGAVVWFAIMAFIFSKLIDDGETDIVARAMHMKVLGPMLLEWPRWAVWLVVLWLRRG